MGLRASAGGSKGGWKTPAPEECVSGSSLPPRPVSSLSCTMADPVSKPSTEERFPLVAKEELPDLETGRGVSNVPSGGLPATPGLSWGGWRHSSNNCSSSTDRQQQGSTAAALHQLSPQLPAQRGVPVSSQGLSSSSGKKCRRWWRFLGIEPLAVRAAHVAVAATATAIAFCCAWELWRGWCTQDRFPGIAASVAACVVAAAFSRAKNGGITSSSAAAATFAALSCSI